VPSLGAIPEMKIDSVGVHCAEQPRSALSEAVRSLRTSLQFSTSDGLPKSLLITSTRSGEGKSSISAGLGISFSQLGMRVLLIDADLRNPSLSSEIWGVDYVLREDEQGLSNFLSSAVAWDLVAASTLFQGLKFIPTGPLPPNPAELLAGPRFAELLLTVKNEFDIVIIDGPPVLELADAPSISSNTKATLMVLSVGETRRRAMVSAVARLRSANARIIGFVLNKTKRGSLSYGYGYGDGYSYGGGKD
jgi:polysaccharide biosynthesis transport protein